jgi:hypothetical protein
LKEIYRYKGEELLVIETSNAIVEPFAVMVEDGNTSIAVPAVFGSVIHIC